MAAQLAKRLSDENLCAKYKYDIIMSGDQNGFVNPTPATFRRIPRIEISPDSSFELPSDDNQYNDDTERSSSATEDTGVQNSRAEVFQRATLVPSTILDSSTVVNILALMLPLVSVSNLNLVTSWLAAPGTAIRATEILICHLTRCFERLRAQIRRLARDQVTRDLFATAMDVVLVVYAIGFLILSLYQASIIG